MGPIKCVHSIFQVWWPLHDKGFSQYLCKRHCITVTFHFIEATDTTQLIATWPQSNNSKDKKRLSDMLTYVRVPNDVKLRGVSNVPYIIRVTLPL